MIGKEIHAAMLCCSFCVFLSGIPCGPCTICKFEPHESCLEFSQYVFLIKLMFLFHAESVKFVVRVQKM